VLSDVKSRFSVACFVVRFLLSRKHMFLFRFLPCLRAIFARRDTLPFSEWVSCPHCLDAGRGEEATRLDMKECVRKVVACEQHYSCGGELVPVRRLHVDVTFGELHVFEASAVQCEPEPFAAGSYGIISRARLAGDGPLVVIKELNPGKGELTWCTFRVCFAGIFLVY
jgi:hypothetical protein